MNALSEITSGARRPAPGVSEIESDPDERRLDAAAGPGWVRPVCRRDILVSAPAAEEGRGGDIMRLLFSAAHAANRRLGGSGRRIALAFPGWREGKPGGRLKTFAGFRIAVFGEGDDLAPIGETPSIRMLARAQDILVGPVRDVAPTEEGQREALAAFCRVRTFDALNPAAIRRRERRLARRGHSKAEALAVLEEKAAHLEETTRNGFRRNPAVAGFRTRHGVVDMCRYEAKGPFDPNEGGMVNTYGLSLREDPLWLPI